MRTTFKPVFAGFLAAISFGASTNVPAQTLSPFVVRMVCTATVPTTGTSVPAPVTCSQPLFSSGVPTTNSSVTTTTLPAGQALQVENFSGRCQVASGTLTYSSLGGSGSLPVFIGLNNMRMTYTIALPGNATQTGVIIAPAGLGQAYSAPVRGYITDLQSIAIDGQFTSSCELAFGPGCTNIANASSFSWSTSNSTIACAVNMIGQLVTATYP
jgi:hypothetical protein